MSNSANSQPTPFAPIPISQGQAPSVAPVMPTPAAPPKPKKEIPSTANKVVGAKIVLQFKGQDGNLYDATTDLSQDEFKFESYMLNIDEKHVNKKDEQGDLIGREDTGERTLTLKLRYHVRW